MMQPIARPRFDARRLISSAHAAIAVVVIALSITATPGLARAQADDPPEVRTLQDGVALAQQEKWAEAIEIFKALTEADADNGAAWFYLGYALHGAGELDEALPIHEKAAQFRRYAPTAMYNIACIYSLRNEKDTAFEWLTKAVRAGFSNRDALDNDPDLENLRGDPRLDRMKRYLNGPRMVGGSGRSGQSRPVAPASADPRRQFDFWVGEWDVFDQKQNKLGTNRIELHTKGHIILENWTSVQGGTGKSMNYYDPAKKEWVQIWVSDGGSVTEKRGGFVNGAMRLQGTHTLPDGEVRPFRAILTPNADGTIRQLIEESKDDGETWEVWFDGVYIRRTDD